MKQKPSCLRLLSLLASSALILGLSACMGSGDGSSVGTTRASHSRRSRIGVGPGGSVGGRTMGGPGAMGSGYGGPVTSGPGGVGIAGGAGGAAGVGR